MNKDKFKQSIDNIHVPIDKLVAREKVAMFQGKKKRNVRKVTTRSFLVACGICLSILASGFFSTAMAGVLSYIPLIGTIYQDFNDVAADKVERDQLATVIDKQDSENGLTMTVKEAVYDGNRLMVSVVYTGDKELSMKEEEIGFDYITINGQENVNAAIGSGGQSQIDAKTIIEHNEFTFSNYNEYGDKIDVAVHGKDLFGYKGELKVTFPLEKITGDVTVFRPGVTTELVDDMYRMTAEQVMFSPLSTRIDVKVDYPAYMNENDTWPGFSFSVVDDTGRVYEGVDLQSGWAGNYGHHVVLTLPPMDTMPKSFTLTPINKEKEVKELELIVPLNQSK
jgi:Family of unknown function (DUF5643)/Domain of unknown function (DUF4179)